jgi:hypothetical protein
MTKPRGPMIPITELSAGQDGVGLPAADLRQRDGRGGWRIAAVTAVPGPTGGNDLRVTLQKEKQARGGTGASRGAPSASARPRSPGRPASPCRRRR